jgi:hypothetical protein
MSPQDEPAGATAQLRSKPIVADRDDVAIDQLGFILGHLEEIRERTGHACDTIGPCSFCRAWVTIRAAALEIFEELSR